VAWNFMQIELVPADAQMRPLIGPGSLERPAALGEVQSLLDRAGALSAEIRQLAEVWRRGAKDDTVIGGMFIWTVYEHPEGEDPRKAALAWMEDFAATMRTAGVTVQVPKLP